MANITILWDIASDTGTLTGAGAGTWVESGGLSVGNLRTDDLAAVGRYLDIGDGAARLVAAFDRPRPVSAWAIIGHNSSTAATFQPGLSESADLSSPVYLPDPQPVWEPTVVFGSLPWGAWPWDGVDKDSFPGAPIAFHRAPQTFYTRYAWVDIADATHPDGYWQAGRLLIGQGYSPPADDNMEYGAQVRIVDPSTVRRTRGGRRLVGRLPKYRTWRFTLDYQSEAAAIGVYHDLMWRLGKAGDMLIVWDADQHPSIRNRLSLYCALADTGPLIIQAADAWTVTFDVEELV